MKINKEIAQKIVWRTMKIIPYSVNVMDENGVIIASGNASRLNQRHTGAVLAIRENRVVEITAELAKLWNFEAQEGINLPINYQGKILGVVGISGKPDEVKPFAELVKMSAELIAEQAFVLEQERWHHRYKEEFILQLLNGVLDAECCAQQASFFSIDLTKPYVAVIIKLGAE
ncbi:sugar diacid recognition domain-containing protein, partial [Gallibacterium anatis]|uniref:sugar diacid recognition domain-containing protein n=1 Tax=Gallibacterium anatis TaxID=750 RepID=UPI000804EB94